MSFPDLVVVILLGIAAFKGYNKGLFLSLLSIVAFIVSLILAFVLLDIGVEFLQNRVNGFDGLLPYIAFLMIFGLLALLINLGGTMVKKAMDVTLLGSVDSVAGAIVGVFKWIFGLSMILWLTEWAGLQIFDETMERSKLLSYIQPVAPWVIDKLSVLWPLIETTFESIKERLHPALN